MLLNKLEAIHHKFLETQEKLSDPEVVSDVKRFAKLNKEYKKLDEVNNIYQEYKTLLSNKEEALEMLKDEDPEMKEMAKMELESVNPAIDEIEEKIKVILMPKDPDDDRMSSWRLGQVQVEMRRVSSQETSIECTISTSKLRNSKQRFLISMREVLVVIIRLSWRSRAQMSMVS